MGRLKGGRRSNKERKKVKAQHFYCIRGFLEREGESTFMKAFRVLVRAERLLARLLLLRLN